MIRSLLLQTLAIALALATTPALAQDTPIMGSQASSGDTSSEAVNDTYRILVIGDALAGGIGAGLGRVVSGDPQFEVANRFQEVSGIARPEVYDWTETLPKLLSDKTFNAVVVLIGSNDRQEIRHENFRFAFNTPDWIRTYEQRTDALLGILKNSGVKIFWLALPPMADQRYDADMRSISDFQRQRVEAAGAHFIDLRSAFLTPDGSYSARGPDEAGTIRNLRDSDGIAFTKAGNTKFGTLLLEEIKRRIEGKTDLPKTTLTDPPPIVETDGAGPVFGSDSHAGQVKVQLPDVEQTGPAPALNPPDLSGKPIAGRDLPPGSAAEKLYVDGIVGLAPAGRFDDYRMKAEN